MALRQWHWGKIVMMWFAAFAMSVLAFAIGDSIPSSVVDSIEIPLALLLVILTIAGPIAAFVVTWKVSAGRISPTAKRHE